MLLAIPVAWRLARNGHRVGRYMLIGWSAYAIAAVTMAALLRGWIDANIWTEKPLTAYGLRARKHSNDALCHDEVLIGYVAAWCSECTMSVCSHACCCR